MKRHLGNALRGLKAAAEPGGMSGAFKSLLVVAAVTAALLATEQFMTEPPVAVAFLVPVLIAAVRWGTLASLVATVTGLAASAFFFYEPRYSFQVDQPGEIFDLLTVALVTGHLAARLRREAALARKQESEIRNLYALSRRLATARDATAIFAAIQQYISAAVAPTAVLFGPEESGGDALRAMGGAAVPDRVLAAVSDLSQGGPATIVDDESGHRWLVRTLSPQTPEFGIVAIDLKRNERNTTDDVIARIESALADAARTIKDIGFSRKISEARLRTEADRFRDALIGSVSHELRTPLASILGATTVLCTAAAGVGNPQVFNLANVVRQEAERLDNEIQNLLDASRISGDGLYPKLDWTDLTDVVNAALNRRRARLADHIVSLDLPNNLPLVRLDSVLVEQAVGQILDNAGKYSDKGTRISIIARCGEAEITLSIRDHGVGVSAADGVHLGERFYRSSRHQSTTPGSGLGLWIARAFMEVNGGSIDIASEGEGHGTTVSLRIPVVQETSSIAAEANA
jgi:two-component system, OmpR family, sensor histidine kinase KdpD